MIKERVVLIVEDDASMLKLHRTALAAMNYTVKEAPGIASALATLATTSVDLVILDLGLPDGDGIEIIRSLRRTSEIPIIVMSARHDERGNVTALDAGADDYMTKPFGSEEMMARIRAALRHQRSEASATQVYRWGDLIVDLERRYIARGSVDIKLTPKEYELLVSLVLHAGKVLTHRYLIIEAWGHYNASDVTALRVYVRSLRNKLELAPDEPALISTVSGVGYRMQAPD